jgi:hypothetical protein
MSAMRTRLPISGCLLLSAVCLASIASAQTNWERAYGGNGGRSVQQTSDSGYVVVGSIDSSAEDFYLVKTNAEGDTVWTRHYGGIYTDRGQSVQQTTDGGYVVAGTYGEFGVGWNDVYLIKTDAHGDTLWTRTYGGTDQEWGWSVQQTDDGGYIVAGETKSFGAGNVDVYLIKTNPQGDTLWTRTYGGPSYDDGKSVQQTTDHGYIIAGSTYPGGDWDEDVFLVRTDSLGNTLWTRHYGGTSTDNGYSVQQTTDGGYIIAGSTYSFGVPRTEQVYLVKTDSRGETLWTRVYGDGSLIRAFSVQQTTDGGYVVAGQAAHHMSDVFLLRTDPQGVTLWTKTYGGEYFEIAYSVRQTTDGGYIIAGDGGVLTPPGGGVYLIKTNGKLDAAPVSILSPPGTAESGYVYVPRAVVRGHSATAIVFPVTMRIGSGYSETVQETLVSEHSDTIEFPEWIADPAGPLEVTCFTSLAGDEEPTNDTIKDSIQVLPPPWHDVGAVAIVSPTGSVRAGDTVISRARIKNFGNVVERFFDVRFRIGVGYSRTVNVADVLPPDSTAELTFPPWVADSGDWAVSCSTMLASDMDSANDNISSSVQVFLQSLQIAPDQSDRLEAGKNKTYQFYALIQGDTGGVVKVARPSAPAGWNARLCDATGVNDLTDTDGDGIPDLGYVAPGESSRLSLEVTAPSALQGDTASLARPTFLVAGHLGSDSRVADTAVLSLTLVPTFSVHNFPNPFSDHTAFVIGLPEDGKASLIVYTRAGERVCRVLENADMPAGIHFVSWDGVNDNGRSMRPGPMSTCSTTCTRARPTESARNLW